MKNIKEFFETRGISVVVEGNKPLLLDDPKTVWLVDRGKINVFLTLTDNGAARSARFYLFDAGDGDILFGINPALVEPTSGLLVTGLSGTRLLQLTVKEFIDYIKQKHLEDDQDIARLINHWLKALSPAPLTAGPPQIKILADSEDFLQVENAAGDNIIMPLAGYHELALKHMVKRRHELELSERERFARKANNERRFMDQALNSLASVSQTKQTRNGLAGESDDPLVTACQMVGSAMKIRIVPLPHSVRQKQVAVTLDDIARNSQVRVRQVALQGEWWNQDNGPLLAYMEEDNRPVALIPLKPGQYQVHDPAHNSALELNINTARLLKPFAYVFFRPFPPKRLTLKDMLVFGMESCWKADLWMVIVTGILGGLLGTAIPVATGIVFDTVIPQGEKSQMLQVAFILGAVALGTALFQLTRSFATLRVEGKLDGSLQAAVWDRLLSLPVPFFKDYTSGELAMRAMGISQIRMLLTGVTLTTILSGIFSVFNFALLFYYDLKLALIASLLVLAAVGLTLFLGFYQIRYERQIVTMSNKISGLVLQLINSVGKLKAAGAEKRAFYLWSKDFSRQKKINFKNKTIENWLETFNSVLPVSSSMVIFYAAASSSNIALAPGQFIAFNSALTSFMASMVALTNTYISINIVVPLFDMARPILETLPEYDENGEDCGVLTGSIEVSHVTFRYKKDGPLVLNDVSLLINAGEYIGIVGTSGSGKSTLFRILLGFEKPESGRVYYDGKDLEKVDIRSVRRQLGVVLQNGQLMSGDIYTNIVGANPHLTMNDAWEAARMSGLDKDINDMPMGMHTVVSEGAGTFSGGQKQRLLIARAIVNKPKILYFDEATSALDNHTQAIVAQSLDRLKATRVVIAHRLSTVVNCDRIIVMDNGKIIETGAYEELMGMNGVFAELARRQLA